MAYKAKINVVDGSNVYEAGKVYASVPTNLDLNDFEEVDALDFDETAEIADEPTADEIVAPEADSEELEGEEDEVTEDEETEEIAE